MYMKVKEVGSYHGPSNDMANLDLNDIGLPFKSLLVLMTETLACAYSYR